MAINPHPADNADTNDGFGVDAIGENGFGEASGTSVAPSGMLSTIIEAFAALLASCQAFQAFCGIEAGLIGTEAGASLASERIYLYQLDEPARADDADPDAPPAAMDTAWYQARAALRPLALVGYESGLRASAEDTGSYWHKDGPVVVVFEEMAQNAAGVASATNRVATKDALVHLMNHVGAILEEIEAKVSKPATAVPDIRSWTMKENPGRFSDLDVAKGELDLAAVAITFARSDM